MTARREYPERPIVGVGGVVVRAGRVLLVKRAQEPLKGKWSLPGGVVELGETLEEAVTREVREETGLEVGVQALVEAVDRVTRDSGGRIQYHYVLLDYLCNVCNGEAQAGSDVSEVAWVEAEELSAYGVVEHTAAVIRRGLARARRHSA